MFDGKAAIVTGAGRGIGRAIAMALAARAARVMVNDIEEAAVERVVAEIRDLGGAAVGMVADVTREEEVDKLVSACVSKFDTVDILVNNAGIVQTGPLTSITAADWDRVMAVNLKGVFLCCRAVFPIMMQKGGGKIVNVASVAGKRGGGFWETPAMPPPKGVIAFTKSAAREGAPYGINVNAVAPALTDTDMTAGMDANQRDAILGMVPLGRAGRPEDVAKAVCFLASSESDYLTGEIMDVDGGLMMD
ncbi:SDR family NAD(P)-dependent oxidoreductase [Kyrpidia spormannii]|uniref:3-oxoacyl-[acyl-carrier-protein] reductase FabG n=1 Tax=Kyrpidia spormannii TaxID=2055160 RepID=A0ACA8ZBZ1_9BACL|nr:SDR family NAD(P)-dependent oxidoreductase [Kyrpidia spormannii]CAB3394313.1 3-oxoacyl-[acyl-carrier-protein] reductase FabG [Kyrpidia spormannii]